MVYCGEREERVREVVSVMSMGQERSSKPPLHNFDLPFLKWGNQRHLRCMKLPATAAGESNNGNEGRITMIADRNRSNRSPPAKFGSYEVRRFKAPTQRFDGGGRGVEEGIDAVREKIMLDLKTAANKMKDEILRKEAASEDDEDDEEAEEQSQSQSRSPPQRDAAKAAAAAEEVVVEAEPEARPWNLRTRRAAIGGSGVGNSVVGKMSNNCSPLRSDSAPRLRGDKREREKEEKEKKERAKFWLSLSRKEIEEDFMAILGQRPARRPKKRPRIVQKQMDVSQSNEFFSFFLFRVFNIEV